MGMLRERLPPLPDDIAAIPRRRTRREFRDGGQGAVAGLRLLVGRRVATWRIQVRGPDGKPARRIIGYWPSMDRAAARRAALAMLEGAPPETESEPSPAPAEGELTFAQVREAYFDSQKYRSLKPTARRDLHYKLRSDRIAALSDLPLSKIDADVIQALRDEIAGTPSPRGGNLNPSNYLRPVRTIFKWARQYPTRKAPYLRHDPFADVRLPANMHKVDPFSMDELREMLCAIHALPDNASSPVARQTLEGYRDALMLCALTGSRPASIIGPGHDPDRGPRWRDYRDGCLWFSSSKIGLAYAIPLSIQAQAILERRRRVAERRGDAEPGTHIFPDKLVLDAHVDGAKLRARMPGSPYRLRSSFSTKMWSWSVDKDARDLLVGHLPSGSEKSYVKLEPNSAMRDAARRYGDFIAELCPEAFPDPAAASAHRGAA